MPRMGGLANARTSGFARVRVANLGIVLYGGREAGAGTLLVCLDESSTRADAEPLALGIAVWHKQLALAGERLRG